MPVSVGQFGLGRRQDSRDDLGYGRTTAKFQFPRNSKDFYPYEDPDFDLDDVEVDPESEEAIVQHVPALVRNDPFASKASTPFYFAAGNTKLGDCFERPGKILKEMLAMSDLVSQGGAFTGPGGGGSNYKRTGSLQGWASKPPMTVQQADEKEADDDDEEIMTMSDFASILDRKDGLPEVGE